MMDAGDELKKTVGKALGRIPSGLFILTAGRGADATAMLVSWVQQAGFDPPAVTVAIGKGKPAADAVKRLRKFGLSVLADGDTHLMKKYARGIKPGEDPFAGMNTLETPAGVTVLADALAYLECDLLTACDAGGDHDLFVARVTAGKLTRDAASFTHLRGNGFHY